MKFSILIPAYNAALYIDRCLKSILAQTITDYEVIVLDDGSKDGTDSICQRYAQYYDRIKYVYQDNRGVANSRNRLLDMAAGEWIVFIDSDDYVADDYLAGFNRQMLSNPKADVCVCNMYYVSNGKKRIANQTFKGDKKRYYHELLRKRYWKVSSVLCAKAIRRSLVERHHIRCPEHFNLGEDLFFLVVLLYYAENIGIDNFPRYFYCRHKGSVTNDVSNIKDDILCYQAIAKFINSKSDAEDYRLSLNWGKMQVRQKWYLSVKRRQQGDSIPFVFDDVNYDGLPLLDKIRLFCINHDMFNTITAINKISRFLSKSKRI